MSDEQRPVGGEKPRAPDDHDVTGTGAPRSAERGASQPDVAAEGSSNDPVVSGMDSTSQPASSDEVTINRSGSGGTGGPVEPDRRVEGSTGQTMSEMLSGDDEEDELSRR